MHKYFDSIFAFQITKRLGITPTTKIDGNNPSNASAVRNSKINADLNVLDQLVSSLIERQNQPATPPSIQAHSNDPSKLHRLRSLSFRSRRHSSHKAPSSSASNNELNLFSSNAMGFGQSTNAMPTILESSGSGGGGGGGTSSLDRQRTSSVRQILNTIKNAPHRLSQSMDGHHRLHDDDSTNLTRNMLD